MKVDDAVRSTNSYIYGVSTLLGQEGCLDYLRAVAEYVQERINKEKEGWTVEEQNRTSGQVKNYREEIDRRCAEVLQGERLHSGYSGVSGYYSPNGVSGISGRSGYTPTTIRNEDEEIEWRNEVYHKAERLYGNDAAAIIRAANESRKRKSLLAIYPNLNDLTG